MIIIGVLAALFGADAFMSAKSAVQEIEGLIAFVAMTVAFGAAGIIAAIHRGVLPAKPTKSAQEPREK